MNEIEILAIEDRFRTPGKHGGKWRLSAPVEKRGLRYWPEIKKYILDEPLTLEEYEGFQNFNSPEEKALLEQLRTRYIAYQKTVEIQHLATTLQQIAAYGKAWRERKLLTDFLVDLATGSTMYWASSGHGKSRLIGRGVVELLAVAGIGTVILDPAGDTIDNAMGQQL